MRTTKPSGTELVPRPVACDAATRTKPQIAQTIRIWKPLLMAAALVLTSVIGCGKKDASSARRTGPGQNEAAALEHVLPLWTQGDSSGAAEAFLKADFSRGPLFPKDSPLAISEAELSALPRAEVQGRVEHIVRQTADLKKLAAHVAKLGQDAVARKDLPTARAHFEKLRQFGEAVERANPPKLTQLTAQAIQKQAAQALAALPP